MSKYRYPRIKPDKGPHMPKGSFNRFIFVIFCMVGIFVLIADHI